jgi:NTP pyrophosphatase (non-canonical NTP hydrolase)
MRMLTLDDLRDANYTRQKEWDSEHQLTEEYFGNALAGEVGEACNVVKKLARQRMGLVGSKASTEDLGEELADVIIYADLLAQHYNIDIAEAVRRKFNKTSEKYNLKTRL